MSTTANPRSMHRKSARLSGIARWFFRRRTGGIIRALAEISILGGVLFAVSGYVRGAELDAFAARVLTWLQDTVEAHLASGWLHPTIARAAVILLTFFGFACLLLSLAGLICRVPAYIGHLVLSEFHRRQGHKVSALELLLGISLPIALTLALCAKSVISIYSCWYFIGGYSYIRLSTDPARLESILRWFVRIRTGIDTSVDDPSHDDHAHDDELDDHENS